jgi:hypothetical protein
VPSIDLPHLEHDAPTNGTRPREILVVGTQDWAIVDAVSQLRDAGWTTHRCCDSVETPFPCNALVAGRGCPLDTHDIDVVLDVRPRPRSTPALGEFGAICGLRSGLPLVTAGVPGNTGFGAWATQVPAAGDIVTSCEEAAAATPHSSPQVRATG